MYGLMTLGGAVYTHLDKSSQASSVRKLEVKATVMKYMYLLYNIDLNVIFLGKFNNKVNIYP